MRQRRSRIQRALGMVGALFLVFLMPFASSQVASSKRQPSVVASGELSPAQAALSPILVTGDVPRPGAYTYHSQLRPRDYLLLAGLSPDLLEAPDRVQVEVLLPDGSAQPLSPAVQLSGGETLLVRRLALSEEEEGAVPTMEIEGPAVRVVGAVREPKVVPFVLAWSLEDYLQAAGGVPEEAGETTVWIQRESGAVRPATPDSLLRPGDTILVSETIPEAAVPRLPLPEAIEAVPAPEEGTVTVLGAVRQERSFAYRPELSAEDYIRLAGGFSPQADEEGVIVLHRDNTYGPITEPVRPGDLLFVPRIPIPRTAEQLREELSERRRVEEAARRRVLVEPTQRLSRFGWEFFAPARSRIQRIEQRIQRIAPSVSALFGGCLFWRDRTGQSSGAHSGCDQRLRGAGGPAGRRRLDADSSRAGAPSLRRASGRLVVAHQPAAAPAGHVDGGPGGEGGSSRLWGAGRRWDDAGAV
ncbi:MAG: hypothetical protein KatS3mg115_2008 [Candidatus Poribacteria bacterium]|nr:MAG: hypothetical protein KatS3mg115_2008 [Candidatus Poribacteria bacterium]